MKKIKIIIDSDLKDVFLIGMTINRLCSITPFSDSECYKIELCVVEAVNNSIIHAYQNEKGHEVEVTFSMDTRILTVDVCDTGRSMDPEILQSIHMPSFDPDSNDLEIPERGRGLAIIKEVMDHVSYKTIDGKNWLTMFREL
ncbi:MAG: ATP-binding protein [Deltaproteobacteria bacterium]|nr:ATP-binding protein [Deltaproteobacteria bacterium]